MGKRETEKCRESVCFISAGIMYFYLISILRYVFFLSLSFVVEEKHHQILDEKLTRTPYYLIRISATKISIFTV